MDKGPPDAARLLSYNLALFQGLSVSDLSPFDLDYREIKVPSWQSVFDYQDRSKDVYFLLSGTLIALIYSKDGREIVFARFGVGACFGELAALSEAERSLSVIARSDSTVLVLRQKSFLALFEGLPIVRQRVVAELVGRIHSLTTRNLELSTFTVEQRVASYLLRLALNEGKVVQGMVLQNAPTHAEIAGSVGANREMISRIMARMNRDGIIKSSRQRIEILDPDRLSAQF